MYLQCSLFVISLSNSDSLAVVSGFYSPILVCTNPVEVKSDKMYSQMFIYVIRWQVC